jgi:hypothetical protein
MKTLIFAAALLFTQGDRSQHKAELTAHIQDWLQPVAKTRAFGQRYAEAVQMIPYILDSCEKYDVDPLRVATLAREENSWYQRGWGDKGEVGPLQVMPKWFTQFNLNTLEGQIEAGVWWIGRGMEKCKGDGARAFHWYAFAKCGNVPSEKARRRQKLYERAVKKYRGKRTQ